MSCPYDPNELVNLPIGMFHCPECGCMVIAGVSHPTCDIDECEYGVEIDWGFLLEQHYGEEKENG